MSLIITPISDDITSESLIVNLDFLSNITYNSSSKKYELVFLTGQTPLTISLTPANYKNFCENNRISYNKLN